GADDCLDSVVARFRFGLTVFIYKNPAALCGEWQLIDHAGLFDAGQLCDAIPQAFVEGRHVFGFQICLLRQRQIHRQPFVSHESGIHLQQLLHTAKDRDSANEQRHGERDFGYREDRSQSLTCRSACRVTVDCAGEGIPGQTETTTPPAINPPSNARKEANATVRASILASATEGKLATVSRGIDRVIPWSVKFATTTDAIAAMAARASDSARSCRPRRKVPAPIAVRMAISR